MTLLQCLDNEASVTFITPGHTVEESVHNAGPILVILTASTLLISADAGEASDLLPATNSGRDSPNELCKFAISSEWSVGKKEKKKLSGERG